MHNTNLNVEIRVIRVIRVFLNFYKSTKKYRAFAIRFYFWFLLLLSTFAF